MNFFDLDPIGWALVGFLAGGLSSWLVRGRAARGCLPNILVGILGGLIGGTLAKSAGAGDAGNNVDIAAEHNLAACLVVEGNGLCASGTR